MPELLEPPMISNWTDALARAEAYAPFLARAMARWPDLVSLLAAGEAGKALAYAGQAGHDAPDIGAALRRERLASALALAIGDLAGAFSVARVTGALTSLADRALESAIAYAIARRVPGASSDGFVALALGKQGAGELNFSSDIDPILLFDPTRLAHRPREEPSEAAEAVARDVVRLLAHVDAEGYVFRVDLRLRPASEISPLAIPVAGALSHYEGSALTWERAAFIRARAAAGDVAMGEEFLTAIRPFVWRRSLDFGAIDEIARLTRRIRAEYGKVRVPAPGFDLKRGRGGIREIEFFAQTHQLIHGGRNPSLRVRGTRAALDALANAGLIAQEDAKMLGSSYDRLRTIEHRLQMVSDLQTHALPHDAQALDAVARLDSHADGATLIAELTTITSGVADRYDRLIADSDPDARHVSKARVSRIGESHIGGQNTKTSAHSASPNHGEALADELARLGFPDPIQLAARLDGWRNGTMRTLRSEASLAALDAVQPLLLTALAQAPDFERALARWETLLGHLPSAVNLFKLLEARPALLETLVHILSLAPPLADALARRADLLDGLIDASAYDLPGSVPDLEAEFSHREAGDDYQRLLDRVRHKVGEKRFVLGVQLLEGAQDALTVSSGLARVAEAALHVLTRATQEDFALKHGHVKNGALVILGLGRFGGGMLTCASDLDIIYLFTGDHAKESDGPRALGATNYFNRLASRVSAALSVPTADGALYEVDTRLRPQGSKGLLAVSIDSFERYQREEAWTWEHMALARARVIYGSEDARQRCEAMIAEVLLARHEPEKLRDDVLLMRAKMVTHKPARGPLDIKLVRGGLVDVEFLVHFCQLSGAVGTLSPDLDTAIDALERAGSVPVGLRLAHDIMTRFLVVSRLVAPDSTEPSCAARKILSRACGCDDWDILLKTMLSARRKVVEAWRIVLNEELEMEND